MTDLPEELIEELKNLRSQAIKKLEKDKEQFSLVEQGRIQEIIQNHQIKEYYYPEMVPDSFLGVAAQIYRDIRILGYKKYDALAMWLDHENGLAKDEPELIKLVAVEVGGLLKDKEDEDNVDKTEKSVAKGVVKGVEAKRVSEIGCKGCEDGEEKEKLFKGFNILSVNGLLRLDELSKKCAICEKNNSG